MQERYRATVLFKTHDPRRAEQVFCVSMAQAETWAEAMLAKHAEATAVEIYRQSEALVREVARGG